MPSAQAAKPLPPQELSQADTPPPADTSPPAAPQARVEKPSFFPEPLIAVERAWQSLLDIMSKLQAELRKRP
jgi:hypothetical protein